MDTAWPSLRPALHRQPLQLRLAFLDPLILYQLLLLSEVQTIYQLDRSFADTSDTAYLPHSLRLVEQTAREVDCAAGNRYW